MIDYSGMLREFHEKYGHHIGERPVDVPYDVWNLRIKLIAEEVNEELIPVLERIRNNGIMSINDVIELADALADSLYVIIGTATATGIPVDSIFEEVHRSNMTKSTEKNVYGKTIKGPHWEPPQIQEILERHMK